MDRKLRQIGVVAGQHDLLAGGFGAGNFHDLGLGLQAPLDFGKESARLDTECRGQTVSTAHHATDQLGALGTGGAQQHGPGAALKNVGDAGELDRFVTDVKLIGADESFDEAAQPEPLQVQRLRELPARGRLVDHVHRHPPVPEL
jgi:hypothetical protein